MREEEYPKIFKSYYHVVKQSVGHVGQHSIRTDQNMRLAGLYPETASGLQINIENEMSEEEMMEMAMLHQAKKDNNGSLLSHLENEYNLGDDNYPTIVTATYNFIINWKGTPNSGPMNPPQSNKVTLITKKTYGPENPRKDKSHIKCFGCNDMGNYTGDPKCPSKKDDRHTNKKGAADTTTDSGVRTTEAT